MHRNEINGDWWEIPASRSKNKMVHRVFLTGTARQLIGDAEGYIFESPFNPGKAFLVDFSGDCLTLFQVAIPFTRFAPPLTDNQLMDKICFR